MASRLTGNQKIRLDREILTSGVTMGSRDSTRHRNAAEQTLLEQKLQDLDLQRRKSIQAINSEQEKSLLRFLKTKDNNGSLFKRNMGRPRKSSLDTPSSHTNTPSKPNDDPDSTNSHRTAKKLSKQYCPNAPCRVGSKGKPINKKSSATKAEEPAGLYDAYFSYTPSFLLEEYKREEQLAQVQSQSELSNEDTFGDNSLRFSQTRDSVSASDRQEPVLFPTTHRPGQQGLVRHGRPRARSLHVFSTDFPSNLSGSMFETSNTEHLTRGNSIFQHATDSLREASADDATGSATPESLRPESCESTRAGDSNRVNDVVRAPHKDVTGPSISKLMEGKVSKRLILPHSREIETVDDQYKILHPPRTALTPLQVTKTIEDQDRILSKSSLVSAWTETPRDRGWAQARRRSICTDKLLYQHTGNLSEEDPLTQWDDLSSFMSNMRQQLYLKNSDKTYNKSKENGAHVVREGDLFSCTDTRQNISVDRISKKLDSVLKLRDSNKNENRTQIFEASLGLSTADCDSIDESKTISNGNNDLKPFDRNSRKNSIGGRSRKNSTQNNSSDEDRYIKNGSQDSTLSTSLLNRFVDKSRKNSVEGNRGRIIIPNYSRQNFIENKGRKNSVESNSRKNSIERDIRRNSIERDIRRNSMENCSRQKTVEHSSNRENRVENNESVNPHVTYPLVKNQILEGLKRTGSLDTCMSKTDHGISKKITSTTSNKDIRAIGDNDICVKNKEETTDNGGGIQRGKHLLKKVLLEASAKQLTSSLKILAEESESETTGEKILASPSMFTLRGSISENSSMVAEPQQHSAEEVSFGAPSTPSRRQSGAGNFFLVASALKSGQPLNKFNFRRDRPSRRSVSCIPSDHPCALADYDSRTTSVKKLAHAHTLLQRSAMCMVEKEKDKENSEISA
ncbi:hypothetical protein ElyMa_003872800 [Elysia marginata]|uniref:Uncharacterized protein n=1 Tax=Elysia marginata TaxID=1093978 RepID=A0AAV4FLQ1_9GAST|nr:hypothetical protein ElyMa_003872800 [Elysia marginata]